MCCSDWGEKTRKGFASYFLVAKHNLRLQEAEVTFTKMPACELREKVDCLSYRVL